MLITILAHASLITVGYAYADRVGFVSELGTILTEYEDMVTAFLAAGMLVCIGLLSIRGLRRALPYELWYFLHLTAYLALLLGFAHQFSNGQELFKPGLGRTLWIGLLRRHDLRGRVGPDRGAADAEPAAPAAGGRRGRRRPGHGVDLYHRQPAARPGRAGGTVLPVAVPSRGLWWQAHPFSLSAAPNGRWLRLTVKTVGSHTSALRDLRPDVRIFVEGPWGDFTASRRVKSRTVLIAAGSGIGPIRALLEELPPGAVLIYRASAVHDLHLRDELEHLAGPAARHAVVRRRRPARPGPAATVHPDGHARTGTRHH